jgi:hypothetical protein
MVFSEQGKQPDCVRQCSRQINLLGVYLRAPLWPLDYAVGKTKHLIQDDKTTGEYFVASWLSAGVIVYILLSRVQVYAAFLLNLRCLGLLDEVRRIGSEF